MGLSGSEDGSQFKSAYLVWSLSIFTPRRSLPSSQTRTRTGYLQQLGVLALLDSKHYKSDSERSEEPRLQARFGGYAQLRVLSLGCEVSRLLFIIGAVCIIGMRRGHQSLSVLPQDKSTHTPPGTTLTHAHKVHTSSLWLELHTGPIQVYSPHWKESPKRQNCVIILPF